MLVRLHERGLDSIGAVGEDAQDRVSPQRRPRPGRQPKEGGNKPIYIYCNFSMGHVGASRKSPNDAPKQRNAELKTQ